MAEKHSIPTEFWSFNVNPYPRGVNPQVAKKIRLSKAQELYQQSNRELVDRMASLGYRTSLTDKSAVRRAKLLSNIAHNRTAIQSSKIGTYLRKEYEMSDEGQAGLLRSAIQQENRRRETISRFGIKRQMSVKNKAQQENKAQQTNIQKGIWGAFGGRSQVLGFLKGFGLWYGALSIGRMAKFLAYGNVLSSSKDAQQAYITAAATGASVGDLTSYGYALRPYGGGLSQAGSFFSKINRFAQGALVGKGLGAFGKAALQYGLDITGSGPAGLATREQLIQRISDRLERMDDREKADFAESLEIDRASLMLMKDGFGKYQERIRDAESGSPYLYGGSESLNKLAETANKASSELGKLSMHIANSGFIQWLLDHFNNVVGGVNQRLTLNNARRAAAEYAGYGDSELTWGYTGSSEQRYRYFDFLAKHGLHIEALERERGAVGGYIFEKNWNEYLKQKSTGLTPYQSSLPMFNTGGMIQPQITIDLGGINVSPEAKQELQQIVYPWLETNVIYPLQQSVKP